VRGSLTLTAEVRAGGENISAELKKAVGGFVALDGGGGCGGVCRGDWGA